MRAVRSSAADSSTLWSHAHCMRSTEPQWPLSLQHGSHCIKFLDEFLELSKFTAHTSTVWKIVPACCSYTCVQVHRCTHDTTTALKTLETLPEATMMHGCVEASGSDGCSATARRIEYSRSLSVLAAAAKRVADDSDAREPGS